jgi:hypothetical protein
MCLAGLVGGAVNALVSDNGFILPKPSTTTGGANIWQPGFVGTMLVGAFAAGVNWGLYGPFTDSLLFGHDASATPSSGDVHFGLTLASVVTAALVGFAGARWLTNEVDKKLLQAAAGEAAGANANPSAVPAIATATPAGALAAARALQR